MDRSVPQEISAFQPPTSQAASSDYDQKFKTFKTFEFSVP